MIISPASRIQDVHEYYFSRKLEQIRRLNDQGRDVVNLGIGSPDLPPADEAVQATVRAIQSPANHGYAPYRSTPALRSAIAGWYASTYSVRADSETQVLPLLGSKEGLFYISMAFLNPGDKVLVPNPGYPAYSGVTRLAGAEPVPYDLDENNHWWPDFKALASPATDLRGVKLMWVNYPHMPTGASAQPELFRRLVEFGREHGILICHDNPYGLVLNSEAPMSLLSFDPGFQVSLELNSFSKSFNMAGWRVGMMIAGAEAVEAVLKVKSNVDSGMFLPLQSGAIQALRAPAVWHAERNRTYAARRELVWRLLDRMGFQYGREQVGMFVWAKAPDSVANVEKFLDEILDRAAVFITPGHIFGSRGKRYARASLCAPEPRLEQALARVEKAL
ncbi:MAG: aminotransferase [Bdellovibrio sp.]|nr:MAG: aminotransferase [Bdellovibrio sp.]